LLPKMQDGEESMVGSEFGAGAQSFAPVAVCSRSGSSYTEDGSKGEINCILFLMGLVGQQK
jgi:hypothetical protein